MNPKILLIGEKLENRAFNGANKALPVLASALNNQGYTNVLQLDLERRDISLEEVIAESSSADLICFVGCLTPQWPSINEHAKSIYDSLKNKNVPIIVGGYATKSIEDIALRTPFITAYFNGEGEKGIIEIAKSVSNNNFDEDKKNIKGLCYVEEGVFHESIANKVMNLDGYDQNFNLVYIPEVHDMEIFKIDGKQLKTAQLYNQRGCPFDCGFCNKSTEGNHVAHVSAEWFEKLVIDLKKQGFEAVYLDDDTETISQAEFETKIKILHKHGLKVGLNTRIDIEAQKLLRGINNIKFAKDHGVIYQFYGVEHTDPGVLRAINKFYIDANADTYKDDVKLVFNEMKKQGVPSSYFIILGLPKKVGDAYRATTIDEDKEAIRFAIEECFPNFINMNCLRFMPGTKASDKPCTKDYVNPFACVRPTGKEPITAAHFLPRVAKKLNLPTQDYHPILRCFESLANNQPRTTAITPERAYETIKYTIQEINKSIEERGHKVELIVDFEVIKSGLISRDKRGFYSIQPIENFEILN